MVHLLYESIFMKCPNSANTILISNRRFLQREFNINHSTNRAVLQMELFFKWSYSSNGAVFQLELFFKRSCFSNGAVL